VETANNSQTIICGRCSSVCDADDNFCRRCGMPLTDEQLPLRHESRVPAVSAPRVPRAVVRAAAVVAVGALTEIMARRVAREAGRRVTNVVRFPGRSKKALAPVLEEPAAISDELYIRRIRVRR
jgi:hypothetical protein